MVIERADSFRKHHKLCVGGWDLVLEKSDTSEKSQLLERTHIPGIISLWSEAPDSAWRILLRWSVGESSCCFQPAWSEAELGCLLGLEADGGDQRRPHIPSASHQTCPHGRRDQSLLFNP